MVVWSVQGRVVSSWSYGQFKAVNISFIILISQMVVPGVLLSYFATKQIACGQVYNIINAGSIDKTKNIK